MTRGRKPSLTLTIGRRTALLVDWARELDIDPKVVRSRIDSGWPPEAAVSAPLMLSSGGAAARRRLRTPNEPARVTRPPAPYEAPGLRPCVGSVRSYSIKALHLAAGQYDNTHESGPR